MDVFSRLRETYSACFPTPAETIRKSLINPRQVNKGYIFRANDHSFQNEQSNIPTNDITCKPILGDPIPGLHINEYPVFFTPTLATAERYTEMQEFQTISKQKKRGPLRSDINNFESKPEINEKFKHKNPRYILKLRMRDVTPDGKPLYLLNLSQVIPTSLESYRNKTEETEKNK